MWTASGTHDPAIRSARVFGFRGGLYAGSNRVAKGDLDAAASIKQQGLDRYATSKLCAILQVYALARREARAGPRFIAFDPGLMPGTGLARERSGVERWAWSTVLAVLAHAIPGASTVRRSAAAYARSLTGRSFPRGSGLHVGYALAQSASSRDSHREDWQDDLTDFVGRVARTDLTPA